MTKEEVSQIGNLVEETYLKYLGFEKYNALFDDTLEYKIIFDDWKSSNYELTDQIMASLHYFLAFDENHFRKIQELCYKYFLACAKDADYGLTRELLDKHNGSYMEANKDFFQIYTPAQALEKTEIANVDILEQTNDGKINIYLNIYFNVPWEDEHGMTICSMNEGELKLI